MPRSSASSPAEHPYEEWLKATQIKLEELPEPAEGTIEPRINDPEVLLNLQQAFGYTQEDMQFFLEPMALQGDDPIGSMGTDTPLAVLSRKPKLLYNYFKQNFAQVTNPPIDPIREELVMSLVSMIGPRPNLLGHHAGTHNRLEVTQPILTNTDLEKIRDDLQRNRRLPSAPRPSMPPGRPPRARPGWKPRSGASAARRPMRCWRITTFWSCRTARFPPIAFRSRRCWRLRRCTIT